MLQSVAFLRELLVEIQHEFVNHMVFWRNKTVADAVRYFFHSWKNGILYLKGGDLSEELQNFPKATIYKLPEYFTEEFFDTKTVVHLPLKYKKLNA